MSRSERDVARADGDDAAGDVDALVGVDAQAESARAARVHALADGALDRQRGTRGHEPAAEVRARRPCAGIFGERLVPHEEEARHDGPLLGGRPDVDEPVAPGVRAVLVRSIGIGAAPVDRLGRHDGDDELLRSLCRPTSPPGRGPAPASRAWPRAGRSSPRPGVCGAPWPAASTRLPRPRRG